MAAAVLEMMMKADMVVEEIEATEAVEVTEVN